MNKYMVLLSKGYEETEALLVVTYLRRAGIEVDTISTMDTLETLGDHDIMIKADKKWDEIHLDDYAGIITPGGVIGSEMLAADSRVTKAINDFHDAGKLVASICASPIVLHAAGIAKDIEGVCYPGMEEAVGFKKAHEEIVFFDQNVLTSRGPLTAPFFALKLIEIIKGEDARNDVAGQILLPRVQEALVGMAQGKCACGTTEGGESCCCGHHEHAEGGCCGHHDHAEGCGCGHHDHAEGCGCGHHGDKKEGGCCGHHHH